MTLSFRGVSKTFSSLRGEVEAVREVALAVGQGELFVLLGPSGCGKSTVLNLAAGLERPSSGEIRIGERVVAHGDGRIFLPPKERNVAMVFQSYALYPHLDVFGNIAFPLRVAGRRKEEVDRAVAGAAEALGIGELLRARPGELSGGQRQRVAIARAIVRKPTLFLLDEPLSNLDATLRASTRTEIRRLQRELRVATLYVTHDQTEAMSLGDRIGLMRAGRLVQTGTPEELYRRPETAFAASFIGSPPMNLLRAEVREEGGTARANAGGTSIPLSPERVARLERKGRGPLLLGIRPEHVRIAGEPGPERVPGTIVTAENLGRETLLRVEAGGEILSVLAAGRAFREGEAVFLELPPKDIHLFPADEG